MSRRVNHYRNILSEESTGFRMLETGAMIRFRYSKPGVTDRNPLCLYLWRDRKLQIVHTINLNYLYESRVEKLYREIQKMLPLQNKQAKNQDEEFTDVGFSRSGPNSARALYERVLKPKILLDDDCYRTYKQSKMKDIRLVKYNFKTVKGM
tara:strand:+ start:3292 stop:3744 length:453 start_codon:yes stop_codon:yes gene_type:complete